MEKTIREVLKEHPFPYAHFTQIIKDKSRGTINQDDAARMAIRLFNHPQDKATQAIAKEIMGRLKSTKS